MKNILCFLKNKSLYIAIGAMLAVYIFSLILPLIWAILSSFRSYGSFIDNPIAWPSPIIFKNYIDTVIELKIPVPSGATLRNIYFEEMLLNSIIFTVGCSFIATIIPCIVAYVTCKYNFRFSRLIYTIVIITMILPIVGNLPSEIRLMRSLGLYNSFLGIFIMKANFLGLYFLVFYASFKVIPWEFAESAFIDGAGHSHVMVSIILPMVKTSIFAVFLLNTITYWNDYSTILIYMPNHPTMAYGLFYMRFALTATFGIAPMQMAGCLLLSTPMIVLFIVFQKRLMGNLTLGGIKG